MPSSSPSSEDDPNQQRIQQLLAGMSTADTSASGVGQPPLPSGGEFSRASLVSSPLVSGVVPTGSLIPGGTSVVPSVATPAVTRSAAAAVPSVATTLPTFSTPVGGGSSAPPVDTKPSIGSTSTANTQLLSSKDADLFGLFFFDGNLDGICWGVVAGGQICCSVRTLCNFKHAKKPKLPPKAGFYVLSHNANGAFFSKPFLPADEAAASPSFQRFVSAGTLLPLHRWASVFKAVKEGTLDDSQVDDVVEDAKEDVKQQTPATPSLKKPREEDLRGDEETGGGDLLIEYLKALWKRLSVLEGQLGLDQGSSSFGTWGAAVEEANDKCSELEEQLRGLVDDQMVQLSNQADVASANAKAAYEIAIQVQQNGANVSRIVAEVEQRLAPKFTAMEQDRARITELESTVAELNRKLKETNALVVRLAEQLGGNVRLPPPGPSNPRPSQDEFSKLQTRVKDLEKMKKGSGLTYSVEGKRFASEEDCRVWAAQYMPSDKAFECFQGLMSLLCSASEDVGYSSEVVTEQIHTHKTGFNHHQVNVIASHKGPYPPSLAGKTKTTSASASVLVDSGLDGTDKRQVAQDPNPFKEILTYRAWNAGDEQTGLRFTLLDHLENVKDELEAHISTTLLGHDHADELCRALLSAAWIDLEWLANQIDSFHQRLLSTVCSDKDACPPAMQKMIWNVVTSSLKAFFDELRTVRVKASSAHNQSDNTKRNGLYLWATLQELAMINEFKKTGFQRHEKIYHRIVMHILDTYASKSAVKVMVGSETSVKASINGLETRMTVVEKRSTSNGTSIGNLSRDVKRLKEKS